MAAESKARFELQAAYDDAVRRRDTRAQHRIGKELRAVTHASLTEENQAERKAKMTKINIADIRVNGGTQSRAAINREVVGDYADAIEHGAEFPPVVVFYDGATYWLADGFHRYEAYARANVADVPADIRQGTQRDAILFSVGANAHHGLRRTKEDRERAVLTLLNDPEWAQWPQTKIAKACAVSQSVVSRVVTKHNPASYAANKIRTVERGGTTYEQNTANIGKAKPVEQSGVQEQVQPAAAQETVAAEDTACIKGSDEGRGGDAVAATVPEPEDPYAKERKALSGLTREGLEDEVIGLRSEVSDLRKRVKKQRGDIADRDAKIKELTSDDAGRQIGSLQRRLAQSEGRSKEHQAERARLQRQVNAQKAEIKDLRAKLESQVVPL